ncbi:MAG: serine hydrolase domain-containing protein [Desulfobacterales bacterium]
MQPTLRNRTISSIILIVISVFVGCSRAPVKPDQIIPGNYDYAKEYITWLTHKEMKRNKVMGVSIAIVDDQKVIWAQGFGFSDAKNKIPATSETVYRIGSISKLFTVMAAMKLAEQGQVDIDRPLKNYLPQFSIRSRFSDSGPITPRTIMTHHSGLPSSLSKGMWTSEPPAKLIYRLKDEHMAYPTNYILAYSNEEMLRPQNQDLPLDSGNLVGLGWFLKKLNLSNGLGEIIVAGHDGGSPLFRTSLVILPEKKLGVVVLTNSTEGGKILRKVTTEAFKSALEAKTGKTHKIQEEEIPPPDKIASEEILESFVGRYATLSMLGSIERKGQYLSAKFDDYKFRLIPSSDGKFGVERRFWGIFPVKKIGGLELAKIQAISVDVDGRQLLSIRYNNSPWFYAEKINPSPLSNTWLNMLGRYQIVNPDPKGSPQDIILSSEMDVLVLRYKNPLWQAGEAKLYLIPRSETEALTLGIGRSSGETMRVIAIDGETGLIFLGYKMMKKNS